METSALLSLVVPVALSLFGLRNERDIRRAFRRLDAWRRREAERYVLRVRVSTGASPGGPYRPTTEPSRLNLGTSVEGRGALALGGGTLRASDGDEEIPSASPTLVSEELSLVDDAERQLLLPRGMKLEVRDFDGARRVLLESITERGGMQHRYSFEAETSRPFWILDAPSYLDCAPSGRPDVRTIPFRREGYRITTGSPPTPMDPQAAAYTLRWPHGVLAAAFALRLALPPQGPASFAFWALCALAALALLWRWPDAPYVPPDAPDGSELPASAGAPLSVTMGSIAMPLWAHGLLGPEEWLFGPKQPGELQVAIAALTDPPSASGKSERDALVGSVAFVLSDFLWLQSDAKVTVGVPLVVGRARVHGSEANRELRALAPWLRNLEAKRLHVVWGEGRRDLEKEGYALRVRAHPDGVSERELEGPLSGLLEPLLSTLERDGALRRRSIAKGFSLLPADALDPYLRLLDLMLLLVLMHPDNAAVPRLDRAWIEGVVGLAADLVGLVPDHPIPRLCWLTCALYADGLDGLSSPRRAEVLAMVRAASEDDPVARLAPAALCRLGEKDEARRLCAVQLERLERDADATTAVRREWLRQVLARCD